MKNKISIIILIVAVFTLALTGCGKGPMGPEGPAGLDAQVYYSEWFGPSNGLTGDWVDGTTEWYFDANAPDITQSVVDGGVVLAYAKIPNDVYTNTVRPMPCFVDGANWDFLLKGTKVIEFISDKTTIPSLTCRFRFVVIPGVSPALKSASLKGKSISELKNMPYKDICKMFNIPE